MDTIGKVISTIDNSKFGFIRKEVEYICPKCQRKTISSVSLDKTNIREFYSVKMLCRGCRRYITIKFKGKEENK